MRCWTFVLYCLALGIAAQTVAQDQGSTPAVPVQPGTLVTELQDAVPLTPLESASVNDDAALPATVVSQSTTYAAPPPAPAPRASAH